jgi:hypothetical protein
MLVADMHSLSVLWTTPAVVCLALLLMMVDGVWQMDVGLSVLCIFFEGPSLAALRTVVELAEPGGQTRAS